MARLDDLLEMDSSPEPQEPIDLNEIAHDFSGTITIDCQKIVEAFDAQTAGWVALASGSNMTNPIFFNIGQSPFFNITQATFNSNA